MEDRAVTTSGVPGHLHSRPGQRCDNITVHEPQNPVPDLNVKNIFPGDYILTWYRKDHGNSRGQISHLARELGGVLVTMGSIWHREIADRFH